MRHRLPSLLLALSLAVILAAPAHAGDLRIGYTNIELVLPLMPEARQVEQQLQAYQGQLQQQILERQEYARQKLEDYVDRQSRNALSPDEDAAAVGELTALDTEIQILAAEAEQKMMLKREELLAPVVERLQTAIDEVAAEGGYTYILNQSNSAGVSAILYGPDEDDITPTLLVKLGISAG